MEMDIPEQPPKEPTKRTRVRLAAPKKQLERTIQKMAKLSEAGMKPEKLVDMLIWMGRLQVRLLDMDKDEKEAKKDALIEENERLKSELAARPTDEEVKIKIAVARLNGIDSGRLKELEGEVETLKSKSSALQDENAELLATNSDLKSANLKLTQQAQSLQDHNAELQYAIKKQELKTPQELIVELKAKLNGTSPTTT
jgi:hypothetical protein